MQFPKSFPYISRISACDLLLRLLPWVSVHQENQPYVKVFDISQGTGEPHVCDGEVLKYP